ncbi:MAG: hutH [Anaerolineales bacterium]|nr:hutH [Anaerolineales bacterium]
MTQNPPVHLDGHALTLEDLVAVTREGRPVALAPAALDRIRASRAYVESLLTPDAPSAYGINTGFGIFADRPIAPGDSAQLARNLILSHAVGVGAPFPEEVVRAAMLVRANTLALGHSGVRPTIIETLIAMLNAGVHPLVPEQGSLGSSGDLAPLCHLALVFTRDDADREEESGEAILGGKKMSGRAAMRAADIPRVVLSAKEGLALNNGATFSAAVAALALADAENLIRNSEIVTAMALEALLGVTAAFDEHLHAARKQAGQATVAANLRALIAGSSFVDAAGRVQDPYSLRCVPQILGPVRDTLNFVRGWIENEINAATDNPLIFPDPSAGSGEAHPGPMKAISGGNFHGEVIGLGMDYLGIALAEVGALAEQQINRMVNDKLSFGLPPMLVSEAGAAGLNSGLMMPHYTAVSLALENRTLAHPDSVHSLPTSAGQEDHNANSLTAARHARQIIQNVTCILGIAFLTAAQAMDLRRIALPDRRFAPATAAALARLRREVPFIEHDRLMQPDIERMCELVRSGEIARAAADG